LAAACAVLDGKHTSLRDAEIDTDADADTLALAVFDRLSLTLAVTVCELETLEVCRRRQEAETSSPFEPRYGMQDLGSAAAAPTPQERAPGVDGVRHHRPETPQPGHI
jgi:hypothetical protein